MLTAPAVRANVLLIAVLLSLGVNVILAAALALVLRERRPRTMAEMAEKLPRQGVSCAKRVSR